MIRGVFLRLPSPLLFSPASPSSYSSIEWIATRNWCRKRGAGLCKGHVWFANGFLWQILRYYINITLRSGLIYKWRIQESA